MTLRRRRGWWVAILASAALILGAGVAQGGPVPPASAAVGSGFSAGNIISDAKFHDAGAMSAGQVQSFLEGQVRACSAGYTCLRDFRQDTWTRAADAQCAAYTGAAGERASTIITRVGAACGINPQVLLVLLQKEQTLVTSTSPSEARYRYATGYACPDTAPCAAEFAGFYNQVYKAAWQYRYYENHPTSYRYRAGSVVNIQWHPNAACGTTRVYIENQATANLYIYTPYAPNAAALSNLYGTGDACSSYGNRNFWRIFSDWFGAPNGPSNPNGALDFAAGALGGIQLSGWAVDPFTKGTALVWINVDGRGGPIAADKYRNWINAAYPGFGNNHGFEAVVPAGPGAHQVCAYQVSGVPLGCKNVVVPNSQRAAGHVDKTTGSTTGVRVEGWSLDTRSAFPTRVWVNIDGEGRSYPVDRPLSWTPRLYPGTGNLHGFALDIPATVGMHQVCVYGVESVLLSCTTVEVQVAEAGKLERVEGVLGGIRASGWSLDSRTPASTNVWIDVDGSGSSTRASLPSASATVAYPSLGGAHGFDVTIPAKPGRHVVCATGMTQLVKLGCATVTVPPNEVGHLDSVTGVKGGISVSGWSLLQRSSASTSVWVDIDGSGRSMRADLALPWIANYLPGVGPNHGFAGTLPATPGSHRVCVTGMSELTPLGCRDVVVPTTVMGNLDAATGVPGGISVSGWAADRASAASLRVWADIDGRGSSIPASEPLSWIDAYLPGVGPNHGFTTVLPASPGSHRLCMTIMTDLVPLGCRTVVVP